MKFGPVLGSFLTVFVVFVTFVGTRGLIAHKSGLEPVKAADGYVEGRAGSASDLETDLASICSSERSLLMVGEYLDGGALDVEFSTPHGLQKHDLIVTLHCGVFDQLRNLVFPRRRDPALKKTECWSITQVRI